MAAIWRIVRIFISSTFRDMHAERDHLVRFVFPELRERCAKRRLHLVDVDLRWGVTEEEAERGKVLEICLDEIERCRPFFIGLLGERYGWVPPTYDVPDEPGYDWVREFEPGHSITAMEIYHGVLRNPAMASRAFFYFRDPAFLSDVPEEHRAVFLPENPEAAEKLKRLKDDFHQYCPVFENYPCAYGGVGEDRKVILRGLEAFGQRVLEDLWSAITQEYPEEVAPPDELAVERAYHEAFIENRTQRFIGRRDLLAQMTAYADGDDAVPLIVTGSPGCGKSALLANFAREYAEAHEDTFVLPHFIGVSPGSTDIRRTLLRLCRELARRFGIADEIPEEYEELRKVFPRFLEQAASHGKVVLPLDGLNQLDETQRAHTLDWLPQTLPPGLRAIVSTQEGDCLDALRRRRPAPPEITVGPLGLDDRKEIVRQTLWDYRKRLDERPSNDQMGELLDKGESNNPLYLIVACEELRVFGQFEQVTERIASLPEDVPALFEQVLERLERDHGRELIENALSLLDCSWHGLLENEVLELLRREGEEQLPRGIWAGLYRSLQPYLRPPGEAGEGALDFFHRQVAKAVRQRYLASEDEEAAGHRRLAEHFHRKADPTDDATWKGNYPRGLSELPYHQTHVQIWAELEATLCDLGSIEAKFAAGMAYDLVVDYDRLGVSRVQPGPLIGTAWFCENGYGVFCPFCLAWSEIEEGWLAQLTNCPACERQLQINPFTVAARWHPGGPQKGLRPRNVSRKIELSRDLSEFADFVHSQAHILAVRPALTHQQAANELDSTAPARLARQRFESGLERRPWLRWLNKPQLVSPCLMTLVGHRAVVTSCAFSPDGWRIVSASADNTLKIWDAKTGVELATLTGHTGKVHACAFSPDGSRVLSASEDKTLKIWDVETGGELATLSGHRGGVSTCAYSPDGRVIVSGSEWDRTVRIWDASPGQQQAVLGGWLGGLGAKLRYVLIRLSLRRGRVQHCAYSPDGRQIVSAHMDGTLKLWNSITGQEVTTLRGHAGNVYSCHYSPDGQCLISAGQDGGLKIWDARTGDELNTLPGHSDWVNTVAYSPDGKRIVSGSFDRTLRIWDATTGREMSTLRGHSDGVASCAWSPRGRRVVSGSFDGEVKVWEAKAGEQLDPFSAHSGTMRATLTMNMSCEYSPDGSRIVSACEDGTLKVWDASTGKQMLSLSPRPRPVARRRYPPVCCYSPDGRRIVSGHPDNALRMWHAQTGKQLATLIGHSGLVSFCAYSPDGNRIVSAAGDSTLRVWDANTGEELAILSGHARRVNVCGFSPDASRIVSGSSDKTLRLWDAHTGQELATMFGRQGPISAYAYSPDSRSIVSGGGEGFESGELKLWNADTGAELATLSRLEGKVSACAYSPDGRHVVLGTFNGALAVLDVRTGEAAAVLSTRSLFTSAVSYSPDGSLIVAASFESPFKVWNSKTGEGVACFPIGGPARAVALAQASQGIAAADGFGSLYALSLSGFHFGPPLLTATRIYLHRMRNWDTDLTAVCAWCGRRVAAPEVVLDAIRGITAHLTPDQAPCLELPPEAWDEPRLLSECPLCRKLLKFNPFIVDNRDRY